MFWPIKSNPRALSLYTETYETNIFDTELGRTSAMVTRLLKYSRLHSFTIIDNWHPYTKQMIVSLTQVLFCIGIKPTNRSWVLFYLALPAGSVTFKPTSDIWPCYHNMTTTRPVGVYNLVTDKFHSSFGSHF